MFYPHSGLNLCFVPQASLSEDSPRDAKILPPTLGRLLLRPAVRHPAPPPSAGRNAARVRQAWRDARVPPDSPLNHGFRPAATKNRKVNDGDDGRLAGYLAPCKALAPLLGKQKRPQASCPAPQHRPQRGPRAPGLVGCAGLFSRRPRFSSYAVFVQVLPLSV
jgi:hypothetical protein